VPLGLALHELATNASKYGCLSVPEGSLEIVWTLRDLPDRRYLSFMWRERGLSLLEIRGTADLGRH